MNPQKKSTFDRLLFKLETSTFNADDIKLLFIELRPFCKNSIIFEIASFFAHPEPRDRGVSFQFIERNHVRLDFHLKKAKVLTEAIAKDTFEKIILNGIFDFKEKTFKETLGIDRNRAVKLLKRAYVKNSGGDYFIKNVTDMDEYSLIHNIVQFTATTIYARTAIDSKEMFLQLASSLATINSNLSLNYDIKQIISDNNSEIFLCISYLLHYAEFMMWDETLAKIKMDININYWGKKNDDKPYLYLVMHIPHHGVSFVWDFMSHECDMSNHIEQEQIELISNNLNIETLDLYRDQNGILKIKILDYNYN